MFSIKSKIVPKCKFAETENVVVKWIWHRKTLTSALNFQLNRYIEKLTNEMKDAGNLEGEIQHRPH